MLTPGSTIRVNQWKYDDGANTKMKLIWNNPLPDKQQ